MSTYTLIKPDGSRQVVEYNPRKSKILKRLHRIELKALRKQRKKWFGSKSVSTLRGYNTVSG
jgi:hypothetical protein